MDVALQNEAKKIVGNYAARLITSGMTVGLGTGSTTAFAIEAIGRRVREEGLQIQGVPTSFAADRLGRAAGIPIVTLDEVPYLDIALDGADEVDERMNLIKGRGGAHTREKVVAALSRQFVVLVDASKRVDRLGKTHPVPVEVLPMALGPVERRLQALGARTELRMGVKKDGPVVTDQGFWIVDAFFGGIEDPAVLGTAIRSIPGVLEHGLFVGMAHRVLIATESGEVLSMP